MKKQDILIRALPITPSGGGCHLRLQSGIVWKSVTYRWRAEKHVGEKLLKVASPLLQRRLEPETKSQTWDENHEEENKTKNKQNEMPNLLSVVEFSAN